MTTNAAPPSVKIDLHARVAGIRPDLGNDPPQAQGVITGKVVEVETRQPLPNFTFTPGPTGTTSGADLTARSAAPVPASPLTTNEFSYSAGFVPEKSEITLGEPIYLDFNLTNTGNRAILLEVWRSSVGLVWRTL